MGWGTPVDGGYLSALTGGDMVPTMPATAAGGIILLHTGANSIILGNPTVAAYVQLTLNGTAQCDCLYAALATGSDAAPTVRWDGSHQAFARLFFVPGAPGTLTGIVDQESEKGANQFGAIAVSAMTAPTGAGRLVIRGGHCVKSSTNDISNGGAFVDWATDAGIYTKLGATELVQNGAALAAGIWYQIQGAATATSVDNANLTHADANANSQGWTIALVAGVSGVHGVKQRGTSGGMPAMDGGMAASSREVADGLARKYFLPPRGFDRRASGLIVPQERRS